MDPGTCLALVILRPEGPRPFGPLERGSDSQSKGGQPEGCWGLLHLDRILFVAALSIFYQSAITLVTDSEAGRAFQRTILPSAPSPKSLGLRCIENGSPARREEGAYLDRYVIDPAAAEKQATHFQRNPLGRGRLAVFPSGGRRTRSTAMIQIAALRSRLEKQPTDLRRSPRDLGDGALASQGGDVS